MNRVLPSVLAAFAASAVAWLGCGGSSSSPSDEKPKDYEWQLPQGFPVPKVPADNPMSKDKVDLGRHLFYDTRLSGNGTYSCASCHIQEKAFTDGRRRALGSTNETHPRGSMSLTNVAYATTLAWANDLLTSLETQTMVPMFGETPIELGLAGQEAQMLERLRAAPYYPPAFAKAFPGDPGPFTTQRVVEAISAFERTMISGQSPYDRFAFQGDNAAISESAKRGRDLFFSETLECFHCHGNFNFSDSISHSGSAFTETMFHNTGLYNIDGKGAFPSDNVGLKEVSHKDSDMGRFKAPTLRNIAVTAPYMHDGSISTLDEALDHYAAGGRTIATGPYAGNGSKSPLKSDLVVGFVITAEQKADVVHFLESLTDNEFLHDPRFSNPWTAGESP
ncbi:di-heme enzyme [Pendulispora rubella]|uniref:Di-heme enzyme n=1 Tax=Pendulispora rubella TaxID=2741070 RepID=A0ABZ2KZV2_9BACT